MQGISTEVGRGAEIDTRCSGVVPYVITASHLEGVNMGRKKKTNWNTGKKENFMKVHLGAVLDQAMHLEEETL